MAINLGDISFGLGPDTRLLDEARKSILQFGQAVNRTAQSQADGARKVEAAMRKQEQALLSGLQAVLNLNQAVRQTGDGQNIIKSTTATFNRLTRELTDGQVSALQYQRSLEDFQASMGRATRSLKELNQEKRVQAAADREAIASAKAAEQQLLRSNGAYFAAESAVVRFTQQLRKLPEAQKTALTQQANSALANYKQNLDAAGNSLSRAQTATQNFQRSMLQLQGTLKQTKDSLNVGKYIALQEALRGASDVAILLYGPLSGIATRLTLLAGVANRFNIQMAAAAVGISAAAFAFTKFGSNAIEASRLFDRVTVALVGLTGNNQIARAEMEYLRQVADKTGARFETLSQQYVQLSAAAKGTILQGQATRNIFENIVMTAIKLGSTNEELAGTLKAIQQIMSKGKVSAEELRQQLGDRFAGSVQIMATALGKTTAELDQLMQKGQIGIGALVKFSEEAANRFGVNTAEAVDNVTAAEGRWANQILYTSRALDQTIGFTKAYVATLKVGTNVLQYFEQNMVQVVSSLGALSGAAAAYMAALYAPQVIAGFFRVVAAIRAMTVAMVALNAATMMNPLAGAVSILVRLGAAATGAAIGYNLMESALKGVGSQQEIVNNKVADYLTAMRQLKEGAAGTTKALIVEQEKQLASTEKAISELINRINAIRNARSSGVAGNSIRQGVTKMVDELKLLQSQAQQSRSQLAELNQVYDEQKKSGGKLPDIPVFQEGASKDYHLTAAERSLESAKERENVLREQLMDADNRLTQDQKTLAKFEAEISEIKKRKVLTADQQSLLANEQAIRQQLQQNTLLSKQAELRTKNLRLQSQPVKLSEADRKIENALERYRILQEQLRDSDNKLNQDQKALINFEEELANIKERKTLTADQKSLLLNEDIIRQQLRKNVAVAAEVDYRDKSLKLQERADQIAAGMESTRTTNQERYTMQLDVMGLGTEEAQRLQERIQIIKEGQAQLRQLAKGTPDELINSAQYQQSVERVRQLTQQQLTDLDNYYAQVDQKNKNWIAGLDQGWNNYVNSATNAYTMAESAFTSTMDGISNSLADTITSGEASFKNFANSIIAELARIAAKAVVVNLALLALGSMGYSSIGGLLKGLGIGSTTSSSMAAYSTGVNAGLGIDGLASGGPATPGTLYEVNEEGPELYTSGGKTYLMSGADGGYVTPTNSKGRTKASGSINDINVNTYVTVDSSGNVSNSTQTTQGSSADNMSASSIGTQLGKQLTPMIKQQISTELRPGGILWKWKQGTI